jgi:hypothetical protein
VVLAALVMIAPGCVDPEPAGSDASDATDGLVPPEATVASDARPDAETPDAGDARVDAAPNPNVVKLPPTGQHEIDAFTNAGQLITYSEWRGSAWNLFEVYYFDLDTMLEHQVTDRYSAQAGSWVHGNELMYQDHQFYDASIGNYQVDLYHYDIATAIEARVSDSATMKSLPKFNDDFILFAHGEGCTEMHPFNLTLMSRATGDTTVLSDCWQAAESHSISERHVAWSGAPADGGAKVVHVHDLQTGVTQQIGDPAVGSQHMPHVDGDYLVWQDARQGRREVYRHTFSTGAEECLTPDDWEQAWPHVRNGIVSWCDYRFSQEWGEFGNCDVYVHDLLTGVGRRVTTESRLWMPRFVDAGWIFYAEWVGDHLWKLYAHDLVSDGILDGDGRVIP